MMSVLRRTSVVLCGPDGARATARAAEALGPQCARIGSEIIVVVREDEAARHDALTEPLPRGTLVVRVPPACARSVMRARGLAVATGDWVALTETPCIAEPDWLDRLLAPANTELDVIGGAIGNGRTARASDRAAFLAEYGIYGASWGVTLPGGVPHIAAANVVYSRDVLAEVIDGYERGEGEPEVHARLHAAVRRFHLVPEATVLSERTVEYGTAWRERVTHGREHGSVCARTEGPVMRSLRTIAAPLTIPLLLWRIARVASAQQRRMLWRTLPQTSGLLLGWALGEAIGRITGPRAT